MTKTLKKRILYVISCCLIMVSAFPAGAKPMDVEAAKKLPEMERMLASVKKGQVLSKEEHEVLADALNSDDPVILSLAGYIAGELATKDVWPEEEIQKRIETAGAMPKAFLQLALMKKNSRGRSLPEKGKAMKGLLKGTENPFLKLEVARELHFLDVSQGEALLQNQLSDKSSLVRVGAAHHRYKKGGCKVKPVPFPDERYRLILSIIDKGAKKNGSSKVERVEPPNSSLSD